MKKRIVSLLLAFVMTFSLLPTMAWAADNDCSAADDGSVTWPYDADTTTLTISDKGAMKDYANVSSTPWNAYKATTTCTPMRKGRMVSHESFRSRPRW